MAKMPPETLKIAASLLCSHTVTAVITSKMYCTCNYNHINQPHLPIVEENHIKL